MIYQSFTADSACYTLKNHQKICQKVEEKPCSTCLKPMAQLAKTWEIISIIQMCVCVVAQLPEILKSMFFEIFLHFGFKQLPNPSLGSSPIRFNHSFFF